MSDNEIYGADDDGLGGGFGGFVGGVLSGDFWNRNVREDMEALGQWFKELFGKVAGTVTAVAGGIRDKAAGMVSSVSDSFSNMTDKLGLGNDRGVSPDLPAMGKGQSLAAEGKGLSELAPSTHSPALEEVSKEQDLGHLAPQASYNQQLALNTQVQHR